MPPFIGQNSELLICWLIDEWVATSWLGDNSYLLVADHLSRLSSYETIIDESPINEFFADENLFCAGTVSYIGSPWYADIANYLATSQIPSHWSKLDKQKFLRNVRTFFRDDPYLFKYCPDQIVRRCIPDHEIPSVINFCHALACGGHFSSKKTTAKILQCGFYGPPCSKMFMPSVLHVTDAND